MDEKRLASLVRETIYRMSKDRVPFTPFNYLEFFIETADALGIAYDELGDFVYGRVELPDASAREIEETLKEVTSEAYRTTSELRSGMKHSTVEQMKVMEGLDVDAGDVRVEPIRVVQERIDQLRRINNQVLSRLEQARRELEHQKERIEVLAELATKDPLTGCLSRKMLSDAIDKSLYNLHRYGKPFSLIMMDFDNFKEINDRYGHNTGDMVLVKFSRTIKDNIRETDQLFRYGGDEFTLLLPETAGKSACAVANKLRDRVLSLTFIARKEEFYISVSFGVTSAREGDTRSSVIERVDSALYRAKKEHRVVYI